VERKMDLIIPVAGMSTRFPGVKPKWMLTHPDGCMMVTSAISGLSLEKFDRIVLVCLKEHIEKYDCQAGIEESFSLLGKEVADKLKIIKLQSRTKSQAETVATAIQELGDVRSFYIKDSDNYFETNVFVGTNFVSISDLNLFDNVEASNKSYVTKNELGNISNIVEKRIVSSEFCCGGYGFRAASEYLEAYHKVSHIDSLYVSHVIFQMLLDGVVFSTVDATSYKDWGTLKSWNAYKSRFATVFIDIDGVIFKNSSRFFHPRWGRSDPIQENVDVLSDLCKDPRIEVILTTSRDESFADDTESQLHSFGIHFDRIIYGLRHAKRILVNDYAESNPYPSSVAINLKRDSAHELSCKIKSIFGE
jgi:trehalose-6-phosphatase